MFATNKLGKPVVYAPAGGVLTPPAGVLPLAYEILFQIRIDGTPNEEVVYGFSVSNGFDTFDSPDRASRLNALGVAYDERVVVVPRHPTSDTFTAFANLFVGGGTAVPTGFELRSVKLAAVAP